MNFVQEQFIKDRIFSVCAPPSLVGAYYLQPPDARAIILHNDLLSNDACSVTGGSITYWGGAQTEKDPKDLLNFAPPPAFLWPPITNYKLHVVI